MADRHFAKARSWPELVAVHDRFVEDYNAQRHWPHRNREDGRLSPTEVLGWVTGLRYRPDDLERAFFASRFSRVLDALGYATFRRWRLYGEEALAGREVALWLHAGRLTLEHGGRAFSRSSPAPRGRHHGFEQYTPLGYIGGMRLVFAAGRGRDRRAGLLAALLVLALVFCHGLFGGLHLVSGSSGVSTSAAGGLVGDVAGVHAQHTGASGGHGAPQDSAPGPTTSDYYAAMLVASFGAALGLMLWAVPGARGLLDGAMRGGCFVPAVEAPVLARGPDRRALLQVYRL